MRVYYPGILMIPLMLAIMWMVAVMSNAGILPPVRVWNYWPVALIATGLEEVYLWSKSRTA